MPFLASEGCFWPLTASMTLEVKNNYAYVINICNKFIKVNFCVGCMVSKPNRLLQRSTTMSLIDKIGHTYPPEFESLAHTPQFSKGLGDKSSISKVSL